MAAYNGKHCIPLEASTDLSSNQYQLVVVNGSGQIALAGDGARVDGVLESDPDSQGKTGSVAIPNGAKVKVKIGGSITQGGQAASDANGKAVDAASGDTIIGTFVTDGSNADEIVEMVFSVGGTA